MKFEGIIIDKCYNFKVLICITMAIITLLASLLSSSWVESHGFKSGLWKICVTKFDFDKTFSTDILTNELTSAIHPEGSFEYPAYVDKTFYMRNPGCHIIFNNGQSLAIPTWRLVVLMLISCSMLFLIFSIAFFTLTMITLNPTLCTNATITTLFIAAITASLGLAIFPIQLRRSILYIKTTHKFSQSLQKSLKFENPQHNDYENINFRRFEMSWSYGLAWASVIFTIGALLTLYLEKTCHITNNKNIANGQRNKNGINTLSQSSELNEKSSDGKYYYSSEREKARFDYEETCKKNKFHNGNPV
ncbi:unnamed protein product [Gordionus sp. m RMFG-2023]|uniref:uncharacterized protein LOC135926320 isoform X1 n=1 Tax=Gordionus sp. m RMFG-2023 TaxID=3053472 RepID=UPI0030DE82F7